MRKPIAYPLDAFLKEGQSVEKWWEGLSENIRRVTLLDLELRLIKQAPDIHPTAYLSDYAFLQGGMIIGAGCYIAPTAVIRLDEKPDLEPLVIGEQTNIQDGACIHDDTLHIGSQVIVAHHAIVHGAHVEDRVTFYIKSVADVGSVLGEGSFLDTDCYVGRGIVLRPDSYVPPGTMVTTQDQADALPNVPEQHKAIRDKVLSKNIHHSVEYRHMLAQKFQ